MRDPRLEDLRAQLAFGQATVLRYLAIIDKQTEMIQSLAGQVIDMKRAGFVVTPKVEKKKTKKPELSDEAIVRTRDLETINRMATAFEAQGLPKADAKKEAIRIREESTRTTLHPSNA